MSMHLENVGMQQTQKNAVHIEESKEASPYNLTRTEDANSLSSHAGE